MGEMVQYVGFQSQEYSAFWSIFPSPLDYWHPIGTVTVIMKPSHCSIKPLLQSYKE